MSTTPDYLSFSSNRRPSESDPFSLIMVRTPDGERRRDPRRWPGCLFDSWRRPGRRTGEPCRSVRPAPDPRRLPSSAASSGGRRAEKSLPASTSNETVFPAGGAAIEAVPIHTPAGGEQSGARCRSKCRSQHADQRPSGASSSPPRPRRSRPDIAGLERGPLCVGKPTKSRRRRPAANRNFSAASPIVTGPE